MSNLQILVAFLMFAILGCSFLKGGKYALVAIVFVGLLVYGMANFTNTLF